MPTFRVSVSATINISYTVNAPTIEDAEGSEWNPEDSVYVDAGGGLAVSHRAVKLDFLGNDAIDWNSIDVQPTAPEPDEAVACVVEDEVE